VRNSSACYALDILLRSVNRVRLAVALILLLAASFPTSLSLHAQSLTLTPQQSAAIDAVFAR